ncbi:MAG: hypothetical protein K0S28_934 [Paucimonas sp.]|jgi:general secretion pathway protein C|nr:hypothetical protein [Paucimonas sp.]
MKRSAIAAGFLLFVALCASLAYWGMQLFKPPARPVAAPPQASNVDARPEVVAALFGGRPVSAATVTNYQLKGVILSGSAKESIAILVPEGKPAKAIAVDGEVAPGVVVKEVHPKYVVLSEGGVSKRVELPVSAPSSGGIGMSASPVPVMNSSMPVVVPNQPPPENQAPPPEPPPPPPEPQPNVESVQPPPVPPNPGQVVPPGRGYALRR